jgi:hypothetical protein
MLGDPFKKALPGQRLVIPADVFNGFVDAANCVCARQHNTESDAADKFCQTGIVRVRNNTGFALPRFAVLALSEPIIGPLANLQEFKNTVNFEGGTPYEPIAAGRFAVLLEPLDVNAIGRGIVAGIFEPRTRVLGC